MDAVNKYEPLGWVLANSNQKKVRLTFERMDALCSLPRTAYTARPFWANTWQNQRAWVWLQAGYVVDEISLGHYIVFRRDPKQARDPGAGRKNRASGGRIRRGTQHPAAAPKPAIPLPCPREMERYLVSWEGLENYPVQKRAMDELFTRHCPENKSLSDILLKVAVLNTFYSTNIYSITPVAQHILALDIDPRLAAGDLTLVGDIQRITIGGKEKNFYSFATRYCSHHAPDRFPIYDSYVGKMLCYFRDQDGFCDFRDIELKDYPVFKRILARFQAAYGLTEYSVKDVDKYLWQMGKQYFPQQYGKRE